jgi:hypothetical protein
MTRKETFERTCAFQVFFNITEKVKTGIISSEKQVVAYDVKCGLVQSIYGDGYLTYGEYNHDCRQEICPLWKNSLHSKDKNTY